MMIAVVDIVLLALMVALALSVVALRNLFAVVMLTGIFSFLSAAMFTQLDAVDVAFTEAAVGAGVATVLMLSTLSLTVREAKPPPKKSWLGLVVVLITGVALIYGTSDMPAFGDPNAPAHRHVAPHYIQESEEEIGVPNIVTSVLASYRGYDTLGETAVIFTAGVGVILLVGRVRREEDS